MGLTRAEAKRLLDTIVQSIPHEKCHTCDCFQGFLCQLELDATENIHDLTEPYKIPREQMHGCLGCDPCPPAKIYTDYLKSKDRPSTDA